MFGSPKTRNLVLAALVAATLLGTPSAFAGSLHGPGDVLGAVYGWLQGMWDSIVSITSVRAEDNGPMIVPNGPPTHVTTAATEEDPGDEFGPFVIPNG